MARLVSKAEFADLAGVTRAAITKAIGKRLAPAMVGDRIDLDHLAAKRYFAGRDAAMTNGADSATVAPKTRTEPRREAPEGEAIEGFLDMTLREITDRFPTDTAFKDYLDQRKKIAEIREKELKNSETDGRLIPRDGVKVHVFAAIDEANLRLVRDVPKAIAGKALAAAKSGAQVEEIERLSRDAISSVLKLLKKRSTDLLQNAGRTEQ